MATRRCQETDGTGSEPAMPSVDAVGIGWRVEPTRPPISAGNSNASTGARPRNSCFRTMPIPAAPSFARRPSMLLRGRASRVTVDLLAIHRRRYAWTMSGTPRRKRMSQHPIRFLRGRIDLLLPGRRGPCLEYPFTGLTLRDATVVEQRV